jgi:hypothetical protein
VLMRHELAHLPRTLRPHDMTLNDSTRDEGHALTIDVDETKGGAIRLSPATIYNEYVVHGSGKN